MILVFGVVILIYLVSGLMGGLGNYQQLKEASQDAKGEQHDPAAATEEGPGL